MAYFDERAIDNLLNAVDIVSYIGKDVELKRAGTIYKGCCPIHKENTPSFIVSSQKNIYKCFGCGEGGNVIKYTMTTKAMTFIEAMTALCDEHNISYNKTAPTPEQLEAEHARTKAIKANDMAQKYFISSMIASEVVIKTIESRWRKSTIEDVGIGYAPQSGLIQYAEKIGFSKDYLLQVGLVGKNDKGEYYDFFSQRITIPIRNRVGAILGFTCRDTTGKKERAKYLNTKETILFKKGDLFFGEFEGLSCAKRENKAFLVEGAADAIKIKQCGYDNVFAPLGTALTEEQIKKLKTITKNIVIIPDNDAAGQKALVKNGLNLINQGFKVSYVQISSKDIDEEVSTKYEFEELIQYNTKDFFIEYAKKEIEKATNKSEQVEVMNNICLQLIAMKDPTAQEMYINDLSALIKPRKLWLDKINELSNKLERDHKIKNKKDEEALYKQYGFYVDNNCYYGHGSKGARQWSNFTMKPIAHIKSMINSKRLFEITNEHGHKQVIELKQEYLVSLAKFRVAIESMGYFLWIAGETELFALKHYLYGTTITCEEVSQLGWQKRNDFWAWGNGAYHNGEFNKVDPYGVVSIDKKNFYIPAFSQIYEHDYNLFQFERKFVHIESNDITLKDYTNKLMDVCGDNAMMGVCFLVASLFRDVVISQVKNFPILNLFGPKGTGKSQLGHSLTSFFMIGNNPPNINNTTIPALSECVAQVSNSIVHIDEYKNNLELERREFLKGLWDGAGRSRMNMDRDKKREITAVDAAVVLSGQEMPTADIALFSRLIFLIFNKTTYTEKEELNYKELKRLEARGLSHLTNAILNHRGVFIKNYGETLKHTVKEYKNELAGMGVDDRLFNNWIVVIAAYYTLERELDLSIDKNKLNQFAIKGILNQLSKTQQNDELAGFWETVENLHKQGLIQPDANFTIKHYPKPIKLNEFKSTVQLDVSHQYLAISFNLIAELYLKNAKITGGKIIPKDSLKYYLENSPEYVGIMPSARFKIIDPRTRDYAYSINGEEQRKEFKYTVTTAMLFDYTKIVERYGISIFTIMALENDEKENHVKNETPVFTQEIPF